MFLLLRVFKCSETWTPACPAGSFTLMRTSSGSDWDCNRRCINKGLLNLFNVARLFALKFRDLFSLCNFTFHCNLHFNTDKSVKMQKSNGVDLDVFMEKFLHLEQVVC